MSFSLRNDSNQRRWEFLTDDSRSWNIDLVQPFRLFGEFESTFWLGLSKVDKERDSEIRRFAFRSKGAISGNIDLRRNESVEDVIFDETIDPNGWQLEEVSLATDSYVADQKIDAFYMGFDTTIGSWLRLAGRFQGRAVRSVGRNVCCV